MASPRGARFPLLACLPVLFLVSCNLCGDEVRARAASPDGKLVATFFERNCGATTDFASTVNVQSATEKFDGDEGRIFDATGHYDISIAWTGPRKLLIRCPACRRENVYYEVTVKGDIDITYDFTPDFKP